MTALVLCHCESVDSGLLDTTEQSVTSALKRARATLSRELPSADRPAPHGGPVSVSSELWSYEVAGGSAVPS